MDNIHNLINKKLGDNPQIGDQYRFVMAQILYMYDMMMLEYNHKSSPKSITKAVTTLINSCINDEGDSKKQEKDNPMKNVIYFFPDPEKDTPQTEDEEEPLYEKSGLLSRILKKRIIDQEFSSYVASLTEEFIYRKNYIDDLIRQNLEGSSTLENLPFVIRAIMRLAIFEILYINTNYNQNSENDILKYEFKTKHNSIKNIDRKNLTQDIESLEKKETADIKKEELEELNPLLNLNSHEKAQLTKKLQPKSEIVEEDSEEKNDAAQKKKKYSKMIRSYIKICNLLSHNKETTFIHAFIDKIIHKYS